VLGLAPQLRDVTEYSGIGSSVAELLAEEVLPLAWLARHRRWEMTLLWGAPPPPDEEDVGVERSCCGDEFLSVLL
jgi:hypothetical protein